MKLGRVLIVGGGIGGLSAARALREHAEAVLLMERAPAFAPVGAGILLAANAVASLRRLGIDPVPRGRVFDGARLRRADGSLLVAASASALFPGTPSVAIHRAALHELLVAGLPPQAELRLGRTFSSLVDRGDHVEVDGERYDLVIGADGLHSAVRRVLGGPEPEYCGYTCWRAVVPDPGLTEACEAWGRGKRVGYVPLGDGLAYVFLVRNAPAGASGEADLRALFAEFADPVPELLKAMEGRPRIHHDLSDLPGTAWGRGRVWLLGDAAHAALPNEGQGAAMAIEDALALRIALREADPSAAHRRWVALRDERVRKMQRDSRRLGWVAQWENPLAVALRDALVRVTPRSVTRRQLQGVVVPGLELAASAGADAAAVRP